MKRPQLQHSVKSLPTSKKLTGHNFDVLTQNDFASVHHGFIGDIDLRTRRGRRMLTSYALYCEDMGGEEYLTMAQRELIRRAATYAMICADLEDRIAEDGDWDETLFSQYAIATRTLATVLKQVGIKPQENKSITVTLDDYLKSGS